MDIAGYIKVRKEYSNRVIHQVVMHAIYMLPLFDRFRRVSAISVWNRNMRLLEPSLLWDMRPLQKDSTVYLAHTVIKSDLWGDRMWNMYILISVLGITPMYIEKMPLYPPYDIELAWNETSNLPPSMNGLTDELMHEIKAITEN